MKKNILLTAALLIASATVFTACSSSDDNIISENQQPASTTGKYTMTVEASKGDGATTRALSLDGSTLNAAWAAGEQVTVYNNTKSAALGGHLEAQSDGASTTLKGELTGTVENGDNLTLKFLSPTYGTQDGTLTGSATSIDKVCDYAEASVTVSSVAGGNITTTAATFENKQAIVKFTLVDKADGTTSLSATELVVSDGTNTYTVTPASATSEIYVAIPGFTSQTVTLTATVGSDTYTYEKTDVTFTNGKYYAITVKMTQQASDNAPAGAEAVDLGLSVKWANMNIGATSVTDYGKYYAWGATTDNLSESKSYEWANTPYYTGNGSTHSWSKYTSAPATLDVDIDDAARANWGGSWRMPTAEEFKELLDNTTPTWQKDYNDVSGCNGYLFTSTKTGYTDKSIFLPAAGSLNDSSLSLDGLFGFYWSSTLRSDNANFGRLLNFASGNANYEFYSDRYYGFTVRAVQ